MKHTTQTFTNEQLDIVADYGKHYPMITADQINFDGKDLTPIFDHNAISILTLRLTDIQDISPTQVNWNGDTCTVFGRVTLPDGRTRGCFGSATIGDTFGSGKVIESRQVAEGLATSRCFRQGLRNVAIDLHAAHSRYKDTGEISGGNLREDPRKTNYKEIHVLATEIGLIVDGDKSGYQTYLSDNYDGRTSASDLTDLELHRLLTSFRSLSKATRERKAA